MRRAPLWTMLVLASLPLVRTAQAQGRTRGTEQERSEREAAELELKLQNPITDLVIVQFLTTVDTGLGDEEENRTTVNTHALVPVRITRDWNVLSWTQLPMQSIPFGPGGERVNGIGDTTQYLLLEPSRIRHFLWGAGPVALLPTATQRGLGSGKLAFGPAFLASYQDNRWTVGLLAHHLRSVDGAVSGRHVESTFLKPFLSYTFQSGVAVVLDSEALSDWTQQAGDRWAVPLQLGVSKVTHVGALPLNFLLAGRWYATTPTGGPDWGIRIAVSFVLQILREDDAARTTVSVTWAWGIKKGL